MDSILTAIFISCIMAFAVVVLFAAFVGMFNSIDSWIHRKTRLRRGVGGWSIALIAFVSMITFWLLSSI
jgi:hypothetical protein